MYRTADGFHDLEKRIGEGLEKQSRAGEDLKKVTQGEHIDLPPLSVYRDDIFALLHELKNQDRVVTVQIDRHLLESPDEIKEFDEETLNEMEISVRNPYMVLRLQRDGASLYLSDNSDVIQLGLKERVLKILKPRYSKIYRRPSSPLLLTMIGLALASFLSSYSVEHELSLEIRVLILLLIALMIVLTIQSARVGLRQYSKIIMVDSRKKSGFFKRNRDEILVSLLTSTLTLLLGFILGIMV